MHTKSPVQPHVIYTHNPQKYTTKSPYLRNSHLGMGLRMGDWWSPVLHHVRRHGKSHRRRRHHMRRHGKSLTWWHHVRWHETMRRHMWRRRHHVRREVRWLTHSLHSKKLLCVCARYATINGRAVQQTNRNDRPGVRTHMSRRYGEVRDE
jgi:hypothetical protein